MQRRQEQTSARATVPARLENVDEVRREEPFELEVVSRAREAFDNQRLIHLVAIEREPAGYA
jgi:hypothetical protein